jgi:two-component system chemotaxis response regulator CheB
VTRASITPDSPVRVVVVADTVVRIADVVRVLEAERDIRVLAVAGLDEEPHLLVARTAPDVVVVDADDPHGAGVAVVRRLVSASAAPVLALASHTRAGRSARALEALGAGAADVLPLPPRAAPTAAGLLRARVRSLRDVVVTPPPSSRRARAPRPGASQRDRGPVVAVGASTGGPLAVAALLAALGGLAAPLLLVQHLHADFVDGLVAWLAERSALPVVLATAGVRPVRGTAYVAPGHAHLRLGADGLLVLDAQPEQIHRPSVDELFASVARHAGARGVGVLLTGMGADGAAGLLQLREAGAVTIAEDESTTAVFGMPKAAIALGAAEHVLPLPAIPTAVLDAARTVAG